MTLPVGYTSFKPKYIRKLSNAIRVILDSDEDL